MAKQKPLQIHWDPAKAERNQSKYGVSFDEAATVFKDRHAVFSDDEEHSQKERREIVTGMSNRKRLLTCFFARAEGSVQVIAARTATHRERQDYDDEESTKVLYQVK